MYRNEQFLTDQPMGYAGQSSDAERYAKAAGVPLPSKLAERLKQPAQPIQTLGQIAGEAWQTLHSCHIRVTSLENSLHNGVVPMPNPELPPMSTSLHEILKDTRALVNTLYERLANLDGSL